MRRQVLFLVTLALWVFNASPLAAQRLELAELSLDQRLLRMSQLTVSAWVGAIAYAKAMGQTAEELAEFWGEMYAPGWERRRGQGPAGMLQAYHYNLASPAFAVVEVTSQSGNSITARMNRPYITHYFGDDHEAYGVTVEEYERVVEIISQMIADYLDLKFEQRVEGDWIVFTIARKE
jgi:hypothetical protein